MSERLGAQPHSCEVSTEQQTGPRIILKYVDIVQELTVGRECEETLREMAKNTRGQRTPNQSRKADVAKEGAGGGGGRSK